jgi:hypothetical protein
MGIFHPGYSTPVISKHKHCQRGQQTMILVPNFERVPEEALDRTLSRKLAQEPHGLHSVVECWNPECSSCKTWRTWARELDNIYQEIEQRSTNKKA